MLENDPNLRIIVYQVEAVYEADGTCEPHSCIER